MRRLAWTTLLVAILAADPITAHGQGPGETPRPGVLSAPTAEPPSTEAAQTPRPGLLPFSQIKGGVLGPAGWYLIPTLGLSTEFDDNVFGVSSGRQSDFVTRMSLGLGLAFRSASTTLQVGYSDDAEFYLNHPELDNAAARQRLDLGVKHVPTARTTVALDAVYAETETPTELRPDLQIETGRGSASLFSISPTVSYQLDPRTSGEALYYYEHTTLAGSVSNDTHQTGFALTRQLSPVNAATLAYRLRLFESGASSSESSHAITLGLSHQFGPNTILSLAAGPRVSAGAIDPEVNASFAHRFRSAAVTIAYGRSQTTLIGQAGTVTTQSFSMSVGFEPFRNFQVGLGSFVGTTSGAGEGTSGDTTVYGVNATATYPLTTWMSARAAYRFSLQEGSNTIRHNIFTLSLDFNYPVRMR